MSFFTEDNLPLDVIYNDAYHNVSNQVLEIDKSLVPPGHLWSRLLAERYLIGDDYTARGYITQKLIDLGYIAKSVYSPIIPQGFFFFQSYQSDTWFRVDAIEVDCDDTQPATREEVAYVSTEVTGPPDGSIINFNINVPAGIWFVLELNELDAVGLTLDTAQSEATFLYEKRPKFAWPLLTVPLAIPNQASLYFTDVNGEQVKLQINDQGQLFWTLYTPAAPMVLWGLFWLIITPVLDEAAPNVSLEFLLTDDPVKATFSGTYSGTNGNSGTLTYQWSSVEVGSMIPRYSMVTGTTKDWSVSGMITIFP